MVKESLDAFVQQDVAGARAVCERDDEVDRYDDQLFRELLTYMMEDPKAITRSVNLILVSRHLERIADHATNIAEDVIYLVEGKTIKHHARERSAA
jgi:phosphate transport system protein